MSWVTVFTELPPNWWLRIVCVPLLNRLSPLNSHVLNQSCSRSNLACDSRFRSVENYRRGGGGVVEREFRRFSRFLEKWAESLIVQRATGNPRSWRRKNPSSGDGTHNRERNCRHSQVVISPPRQYIHYLPTWYFVPNCVVRDFRSFLLVSHPISRPFSSGKQAYNVSRNKISHASEKVHARFIVEVTYLSDIWEIFLK